MRLRTTVVLATLALGLSTALPALASEARAQPQTEEEKRNWFQDCLGAYDTEADWYQTCSEELSDEQQYDCPAWVRCFRDQNQFVQTRTCDPDPDALNNCEPGQQPLPVQWYAHEVDYMINSEGTDDVHPDESEITDELKQTIWTSFDTWNAPDCSALEMSSDGVTLGEPPPYFDDSVPRENNDNVITFKDDSWPHTHYDAVALTTVTFRHSSGEILSSDIELNTANYSFSATDEPADTDVDLQNTLTHEIGHFLGLDHSPNEEATMWASADKGETSKRQLHVADVQGLCHIYPEGEPPQDPQGLDSTDEPTDRSCTAAPGPAVPLVVAVALLGLGAVRRGDRE